MERLSGVMPPTGTSAMGGRITARQAFSTTGPSCSAGNIFSTSAPAASAAKASVGVATPGQDAMPSGLAVRITAASLCGMTISSPPASWTRAQSSGFSTVPAPIRQSVGRAARIARMLASGSGEFSGTSIRRKPAS
ncbi:hypothetical protein G6F63_015709 [Rhizopus arrhizus]|nr:hypothetical protein G6F63_015709 [Rhizopus arrhizus]